MDELTPSNSPAISEPRTFGQLGVHIRRQYKHSRMHREISDNSAIGFILRHILELVFQLFELEAVRQKFVGLIIECHKGYNKPYKTNEIIEACDAILREPFPRIIIREFDYVVFAETFVDSRPITIALSAEFIEGLIHIQIDSEEYHRGIYFWVVVMVHEYAHYIWAKFQGQSKAAYTPPNVVSEPFGYVRRGFGENREKRGEAGFWIEAQVFASGVGKLKVAAEPSGSEIGELWWRDGVRGRMSRIDKRAIERFVSLNTGEPMAERWPVRILKGQRNEMKERDFRHHNKYY